VQCLVVAHQEQLLAECPALLRGERVEGEAGRGGRVTEEESKDRCAELRLLYRLMDRTPRGVERLVELVEGQMRAQGLAEMRLAAGAAERWAEQLLATFGRLSALVRRVAGDDARLLTARDRAFQHLVNDASVFRLELPQARAESRCPELLAGYVDLLLRRGPLSRKLSSDEVDARLSDVVCCMCTWASTLPSQPPPNPQQLLLLKYVHNKDVFMRFHKTLLARRLVADSSADQEKEELLVSRLRVGVLLARLHTMGMWSGVRRRAACRPTLSASSSACCRTWS